MEKYLAPSIGNDCIVRENFEAASFSCRARRLAGHNKTAVSFRARKSASKQVINIITVPVIVFRRFITLLPLLLLPLSRFSTPISVVGPVFVPVCQIKTVFFEGGFVYRDYRSKRI